MTTHTATADDHALAARLATEAGELLLAVRAELGGEGDHLKAEGDRRSNEYLLAALHAERPSDSVLSEEAKDDLARLTAERVWIIDPVDGTREYSEGRTDWAVHVALVIGGAPVAGAVALPGLGVTLCSQPPAALAPAVAGPARLLVSRTRPPAFAEAIRAELEGVLVPMGSAGAKAMAVVRGEADIYAHHGGQYEWDSCAPVAVAKAAGLHVSRLDGSELTYNNENPYLPDLLICRPELADAVLGAAARQLAGT